MNGFMSRAACRGRRPAFLSSFEMRHRPLLVGKLLKDRGVPRFIVGPPGYGKTSLALDYAEGVFEWAHVFWVNAQSPCFIRGLDDRSLVSDCRTVDPRATLVVFDDLPPLDDDRAKAFSDAIDELIRLACEVVVCSVPSGDMAGGLQLDRIRVSAQDLLLSDIELDAARSTIDRNRASAATVPKAQRIPGLAWQQGPDAPSRFAEGLFAEELPGDVLLALGSTIVMQGGAVADLAPFGLRDVSQFCDVALDYPHLGFDEDDDCFCAPLLGIDSLAVPLKRNLSAMVQRSSFETSGDLVRAWAAALVENGRADRACDLIRLVCPVGDRARWLFGNAWELARQASFFPAYRLARSLERRCRGEDRLRLNAFEAVCLRILGDGDAALGCAKRSAFEATAPVDVRVCCLLVVARAGSPALAGRADEALVHCASSGEAGAPSSGSFWALMAAAWVACSRSTDELADLLVESLAGGASTDAACVCASWLFSLVGNVDDDAVAPVGARYCACERFVRARLASPDGAAPDYFAASAGLAMEEAHMRGMVFEDGPLPTKSLLALRQMEMRVLMQRHDYDEFRQAESPVQPSLVLPGPDGLLKMDQRSAASARQRSIPLLELRLFGRLSVALGDEPVPDSKFRRRNTRSLLALLALNHGREMPREYLARALWPDKPEESARKSYYTVWSQLRQALRLPDGTCPYLLRQQYGCSLEMRYVACDVERFEEICRELQFGIPDHERWSGLFAELDRDFSNELLPFENRNDYIVQARDKYRSRLVDALVSATVSITQTDNPRWGVWFAQAALAHDETREDAYVALMRAQIASDQRTSAMMTYLACRRVLSERLGIDPSPETTRLYEGLLDAQ